MTTAAPRAPAVRTIVFAHEGRDWIRGSEQCLLDLVARLDPSRFRSVVICDAPTLAREAEQRGARAVRIDGWGGGAVRPVAIRRQVAALLREHEATLVHANATSLLPAVLPAARGLRVPVVAHLHLVMSPMDQLHSFVHQVAAVVGVAEHVVHELRRDMRQPERVRVIPNAVDEKRLARGDAQDLRSALGIDPHAVVAASVGSLIHRKGHDVSIRAIAAARAHGTNVQLLVCGEGEEHASLRTLAAEEGVADAVHFLGMRNDVGAILRDATDVYVSAARDEALPLNVLEAQWAGRAIVCSDIPAHHEAVRPGETGVLVSGEDPQAYAASILALANDPARRERFGRAGQALVKRDFSMASYVGAFEALYDELLLAPRASYGWVRGSQWPRVYNAWLVGILSRRLARR